MALVIILVIALVSAVVLISLSRDPGRRSEQSARSAPPTETQTTASPAPAPREGACWRLSYAQAVAPTTRGEPVPCAQRHTGQTFRVADLDLVAEGHLLAVDSRAAQQQAADACQEAVAGHVGTGPEELRLSMVEAVWFTPTVEEAADGATWLRCDVVAVSGGERLVELPERTAGMLGRQPTADDYAMCGTAEPSARDFRRVVCSADHAWRAVASVDLPGRDLPTPQEAAGVMEARCRTLARDLADDPLDFTWAEERPTREQWEAGRRYGLCWVPD